MTEFDSRNNAEVGGVEDFEVGKTIEGLEGTLPDRQTEAAQTVRQAVSDLQDQGYTFAEGRTFHTTSGSQAYHDAQEVLGRRVVGYYAGGEQDLFSFSPPEQVDPVQPN
jgi:hypothetical protein